MEKLSMGIPQPVGPLIMDCAALDAVTDPSYLRHVLAELIARGAAELFPPTTTTEAPTTCDPDGLPEKVTPVAGGGASV